MSSTSFTRPFAALREGTNGPPSDAVESAIDELDPTVGRGRRVAVEITLDLNRRRDATEASDRLRAQCQFVPAPTP
jgi:hypothetical protein